MDAIKKGLMLILGLLMLPALVQAQQLDMELLKGIKPRNIGPAGMSGRITAIDVVTNDPHLLLAMPVFSYHFQHCLFHLHWILKTCYDLN